MAADQFAIFQAALGSCGIVWSGRGILGVMFAEPDEARTRVRLMRRFPDAVEASPPTPVRRAIDGIAALLAGGDPDLSDVTLDLDRLSEFQRRVYAIARTVRPGATISYGEIAARLGEPGAAREVGEAMGRNPVPIIIPCHRVVGAGGKLGGFSAPGGVATKRKLLAIESVHARDEGSLFGSRRPGEISPI